MKDEDSDDGDPGGSAADSHAKLPDLKELDDLYYNPDLYQSTYIIRLYHSSQLDDV